MEKVCTSNSPVPIPCVIDMSDGTIKLELIESSLETKFIDSYTV
jgi:hypothetical protein